MDTVSEQRLAEIYPGLATLVREMATQLEAEGIDIRVTQSLRSEAEQQALFNQGRDANGVVVERDKVVTNGRPGYSWHEFGLAVDVAPLTPQGPDWNIAHPVWRAIVDVGINLGLTAGAEWRTFPDWPHFQLTGRFPSSPSDEARETLASHGLVAVWRAAFEQAPGVATDITV